MHAAATTEQSYYSGWARVHQAKWAEDQARKEYLNRACGREPWPEAPPRIGPECVVCQRPFQRKGPQLVCGLCRSKGWTAARCDCGRPLHRRDQTCVSGQRNRCGRCRLRVVSEIQPDGAAKVKVAEPPEPPARCVVCGGPKASKSGTRCRPCGDKALCKCGNTMSRHAEKCNDCRRWAR